MRIIRTSFIVVWILIIVLSGCTTTPGAAPQTPARSPDTHDNYFPMNAGREWNYEIKVGETDPVFCTCYEDNNSTVTYFHGYGDRDHIYRLSYRIIKAASKDQVQIQILKDDMGLYGLGSQISWVSDQGTVIECVLSPDLRKAVKVLYLRDNSKVELKGMMGFSLAGFDYEVPGYEESPCCHFTRTYGYGITEDCWYAVDTGLVRLEQKVDGKLSMVCVLEK